MGGDAYAVWPSRTRFTASAQARPSVPSVVNRLVALSLVETEPEHFVFLLLSKF